MTPIRYLACLAALQLTLLSTLHSQDSATAGSPDLVGGWKVGGDAELDSSSSKKSVKLISNGKDPQFLTNDVPKIFLETGKVHFRMKSLGTGIGRLFWSTDKVLAFDDSHVATFKIEHDDQWHDYAVEITPNAPLTGLRLDPSTGPGEAEIETIRLEDANGKILFQAEY